jgi:hypothetical protein
MARLREDGLYTDSKSNDGAFGGFVLGTHNENNGAYLTRKAMTIHVATNPAADETIAIGATTYTFKASGATGAQINIGADVNFTTTNIINKINLDEIGVSAYPLGDTSKLIIVCDAAAGTPPVFTADGVKVVEDIAWANIIAQAKLEDENYFLRAVTDADVKPIVLVERNPGTYQNFLY